MFRKIAWFLIILAVLATVGELAHLKLPTLRWGFETSREISWLHWNMGTKADPNIFPWFGWLTTLLTLAAGVFLLIKFPRGFKFTPITQRRINRFCSIKRGYRAFLIIIILGFIASLDHLIVGNEPLLIKYKGEYYSPALRYTHYKGKDFGLTGEAGESPANYRLLKKIFKQKNAGDWVIMPIVPYAPTQDTVTVKTLPLEVRDDGLAYAPGSNTPFNGQAAKIYDLNDPLRMHLNIRYRKGLKQGKTIGSDRQRNRVYEAVYDKGELISEHWKGKGSKEAFLNQKSSPEQVIYYAPAPPSIKMGHWLGTTPQGYDVLAYLYGGLQVNFKAALFYIPCIYIIGITIGLLMGFFGGFFDLFVQRLIEVFSNIPFLFVIIIVSSSVPIKLKEQSGLGVILLILILFSWMGMTYLMRTAALKEKSRDYVAASRVIGCSTGRIIFKHILPNSVAILVTLVPFSVSGLIMGLTSLDYLGFGLPPKYATWGTLLKEGLSNLSAPWLVASSFFCLVSLLILVTFVGEAVREAFDPKKFTYYK